MWWLLNCLIGTQRRAAARGKRDPWLSPPKAVIDNLVFTRGGVYAEFVMAGQPGGMIPYEVKRMWPNRIGHWCGSCRRGWCFGECHRGLTRCG